MQTRARGVFGAVALALVVALSTLIPAQAEDFETAPANNVQSIEIGYNTVDADMVVAGLE